MTNQVWLLQKAKLVAQLIRNEAKSIGRCSGRSSEDTFHKPSMQHIDYQQTNPHIQLLLQQGTLTCDIRPLIECSAKSTIDIDDDIDRMSMEFIDRDKISEMQIQDVIGKLECKESCSAANRKRVTFQSISAPEYLKKGQIFVFAMRKKKRRSLVP